MGVQVGAVGCGCVGAYDAVAEAWEGRCVYACAPVVGRGCGDTWVGGWTFSVCTWARVGAGARVRGRQGNFLKSGFILVQMVCPKGCVSSAHERPTCGDRDKKSVMLVLLRQNGGRGSVWHAVGLKWHPRFSESVGGASPPALLLPSTGAGGGVAE